MISLDTETTGVDFRHGARPFFVTTCDGEGQQRHWEWDVDPLTREVAVPEEDARAIRQLLAKQDRIVMQNGAFDARALLAGGISDWTPLWGITEDTLLAGHLLHSAQPHDLTSMALAYLGVDIQPYEDRLEEACVQARRICRSRFPEWMIAKEGLPCMPSAKGGSDKAGRGGQSEKPWKFDAWLPRALALEQGLPDDHPWHRVCRDYANADSAITMALWRAMESELKRRGLWPIYQSRRPLARLKWKLERRGLTYSPERLDALEAEYRADVERLSAECLGIASKLGFDLQLPKGASPNGSLRTFCFNVLKLKPIRGFKSKTDAPTLDKSAMDHYKATLDQGTDAGRFVNALLTKRKRDTSLAFLESYRRFGVDGRLYPSANPTGADTLRWTMSNPNGQQVSKLEIGSGRTLRWVFGPAPGREWWALDYENLELRLPAYLGKVQKMIDLFERPDDPPFFGSYHLLNASIIYPDLFWPLAEKRGEFKKKYAPTWYQWCKNAGFALIYGCQAETFDRTAHKKGAYDLLKRELPDLFAYADKWIRFADRHGYVETAPDRTVDPSRGYPVECIRSEWGRISPTVPLNYHIQSTAVQCANKAMIRCDEQLERWSEADGRDYAIVLPVHDELVFDFPAGGRRNYPKVLKLKALMEQSGEDIGVPLRVSVNWHPGNWGEAKELPRRN